MSAATTHAQVFKVSRPLKLLSQMLQTCPYPQLLKKATKA
jgi:hypothetical protein